MEWQRSKSNQCGKEQKSLDVYSSLSLPFWLFQPQPHRIPCSRSLCCPVDEITIFIGHSEAAINLIVNIGPAIMHSHLEFSNNIQFPQCQIQIIDEEGLPGTPCNDQQAWRHPSGQSYHKSILSYLWIHWTAPHDSIPEDWFRCICSHSYNLRHDPICTLRPIWKNLVKNKFNAQWRLLFVPRLWTLIYQWN